MTRFTLPPLSRRNFLGVATASAGAAMISGFPNIARSATPEFKNIKITQAVPSLAFIQNYLAKELGYFADEGLNVEVVITMGGGPDVQAVLAGDAAFTVNDGAQVLPALSKGLKLTCLMATMDRNVINVSMLKSVAEKLSVGPDSDIKSKLLALKGLKIGVTRPGSLTWQLARFNLANAGLNPDQDAQIVGLGGGAAVGAGLDKGIVDVIYISVPLGERVVMAGKAITLIDNAAGQDPSLPKFLMEGLWATPDFIGDNPNTVSACIRALKRATDFAIGNSAADVAKALKGPFGGLGMDLLTFGVERVKPAIARSYRFDQSVLDYTQDVLMVNGAIKTRTTIGQIFDGSYL